MVHPLDPFMDTLIHPGQEVDLEVYPGPRLVHPVGGLGLDHLQRDMWDLHPTHQVTMGPTGPPRLALHPLQFNETTYLCIIQSTHQLPPYHPPIHPHLMDLHPLPPCILMCHTTRPNTFP